MVWQEELKHNICTAHQLRQFLPLSDAEAAGLDALLEQFPMSVTRYYLSLIDWSDAQDPIRRMAIPSVGESDLSGSFDTSGEADNTVVEGLQHKYRQTALILSTSACAMYCRHCFRKRLVGLDHEEVARKNGAIFDYLKAHGEITNVLVSGGDALLNSNAQLEALLKPLAALPQLDLVRLCSRVPVVFPQRITGDAALLDMLADVCKQKQLVFVTQFNHPRELTPAALAAVRALQQAGLPVKNQTVLLRGVNDAPSVLAALLRGLTAAGIVPYYVFQCRPVSGVKGHFQLPLRQGHALVEAAKREQNGIGKAFRYCLSHRSGKIEILGEGADGEMLFRYHEAADESRLGRVFALPVGQEQAWIEEDATL